MQKNKTRKIPKRARKQNYFRILLMKALRSEKNQWMYPSELAGWGQQGAKSIPKKLLTMQKINDDQNGQIHPENWGGQKKLKTLFFHYWGV